MQKYGFDVSENADTKDTLSRNDSNTLSKRKIRANLTWRHATLVCPNNDKSIV